MIICPWIRTWIRVFRSWPPDHPCKRTWLECEGNWYGGKQTVDLTFPHVFPCLKSIWMREAFNYTITYLVILFNNCEALPQICFLKIRGPNLQFAKEDASTLIAGIKWRLKRQGTVETGRRKCLRRGGTLVHDDSRIMDFFHRYSARGVARGAEKTGTWGEYARGGGNS